MYYRNNKDLNYKGEIIEKGSLFKKENQQMVLVDKDRYVSVPMDNSLFDKTEDRNLEATDSK